jgi:hypothetical protein
MGSTARARSGRKSWSDRRWRNFHGEIHPARRAVRSWPASQKRCAGDPSHNRRRFCGNLAPEAPSGFKPLALALAIVPTKTSRTEAIPRFPHSNQASGIRLEIVSVTRRASNLRPLVRQERIYFTNQLAIGFRCMGRLFLRDVVWVGFLYPPRAWTCGSCWSFSKGTGLSGC